MIILMKAGVAPGSAEVARVLEVAGRDPRLRSEVRCVLGSSRELTEVYLLGPTGSVPSDAFDGLPGVEKVIRIQDRCPAIARPEGQLELGFEYRGLRFSQDSFHLFAGLCAVDTPQNLDATFRELSRLGLCTARAGAYKPRTSPYEFQGHGQPCLPYLFELAGKHGIRVVALEVTREQHLEEIRRALQEAGEPTGVMLQIGTRNAQNFELLKAVGAQTEFPVLFKRGMGISLEESFHAAEYIAAAGNPRIVFALRGLRTHLGDPHRNLVDFAHVPVVRRLTRLPVCIDPSHAVGRRTMGPDGLLDLHHAAAMGVIAGANLVLLDVHPRPEEALCDGGQALRLEELEHLLKDLQLVRRAYEQRAELMRTYLGGSARS